MKRTQKFKGKICNFLHWGQKSTCVRKKRKEGKKRKERKKERKEAFERKDSLLEIGLLKGKCLFEVRLLRGSKNQRK